MSMHLRKSVRYVSGFSLIEVLVAVVILATGLLALTALQGRLAQASADAKARSRVASLLTSRLDELRASQYASIPPAAGSASATFTATCLGGATWVCTAQNESSVSDLAVGHAYQRFMDVSGTFTSSGAAAPDLSTAEYKRVTLTATWKDATGSDRSLAMSTDVSPLSLTASRIPNAPGGVGAASNAVVRQDSPVTDGVIPLTVGNDATAASNPRPEVLELNGNNRQIVGTRFNLLTYQGDSGAVRIQRRVETSVIKCSCSYGSGGNQLGEIYREAQWPVVWDGTKYKLSKVVATDGAAPGSAFKAGPRDENQSALCTECCRDHHDAAGSSPRFDPERSSGMSKYNLAAGVLVEQLNTTTGDYINACRLIRVDGFWRTAADTYSRHFALLPTKAKPMEPTRPAGTGVPTIAAAKDYETFAKQYLGGINGLSATPPANADTLFLGYPTLTETNPAALSLTVGTPADVRYLHARGLYIDSLEIDAQNLIKKALADKPRFCPKATSDAECALLFLPISTINLTELAEWLPKKNSLPTTIIQVDGDNDGVFVWDVGQPSRSATQRDTGVTGNTADNVATINRSNVGLTRMNPLANDNVDPFDGASQTDLQQFSIGTATTNDGYSFWVDVIGPATANVSWTGAPCSIPAGASLNKCTNLQNDQAQVVAITIAGYNYRGPDDAREANPCGGGKINVPRYYNFAIPTTLQKCAVAVVGGLPVVGTCSTITPVNTPVVQLEGDKGERTTIEVALKADELIKIGTSSALTDFARTGCTSSPAKPIYDMRDY